MAVLVIVEAEAVLLVAVAQALVAEVSVVEALVIEVLRDKDEIENSNSLGNIIYSNESGCYNFNFASKPF